MCRVGGGGTECSAVPTHCTSPVWRLAREAAPSRLQWRPHMGILTAHAPDSHQCCVGFCSLCSSWSKVETHRAGHGGMSWPTHRHRHPAPYLPHSQGARSPRLYLPEGLQQDAELLSATQCKHWDQHLRGTGTRMGAPGHCPPRWSPRESTVHGQLLPVATFSGSASRSDGLGLHPRRPHPHLPPIPAPATVYPP